MTVRGLTPGGVTVSATTVDVGVPPAPLLESAASTGDRFERGPGTLGAVVAGATLPPPQVVADSVFSTPIPDRRLPRLRDALADPTIAPLAPATLAVPPDLLATLNGARRVLLMGHRAPDGDSLGSCLGLARALQALGTTADICLDEQPAGFLRGLVAPGELQSAAALAHHEYDAVVVLDVALSFRTGAAGALVARCPTIVHIDHHNPDAATHELPVAAGARLAAWIDPEADANCLLVAAVVEQLVAGSGRTLSAAQWSAIATPLMAGTCTDTAFFGHGGCSLTGLRLFKHLLGTYGGGDLTALEKRLTYNVPPAASGLLQRNRAMTGALREPQQAALRARIEALPAQDGTLTYRAGAGREWVVVGCPPALLAAALEAGRLDDPQVCESDVVGVLEDRLDDERQRHALAVLMVPAGPGVFAVSFRSRERGAALRLAQRFGGGGHDTAAGARLTGLSYTAALDALAVAVEEERMAGQVRRRGVGR